MKKVLLILSLLVFTLGASAQVIYEEFSSTILNEKRKLKIQLPRGYKTDTEKVYPIIIVFDADYMFEPVAGNVDYFSYWQDMPESIVVGIMQSETRQLDGRYDDANFFPSEEGANFFEFVGLELMPYIDTTFRTAKFTIAIGHELTANFINYYLFKEPQLFSGYISFSPELAPKIGVRITDRVSAIKNKIFYYLATGTDDMAKLSESTKNLNSLLSNVENEKFNYYFDNFDGATHYSIVARGIPNALEKIFTVYQPISKKEYSEVLLKLDTPIEDYVLDKYKTIKDLFGLERNIRVNDFLAAASAAEKLENWDSLKAIANLAQKQYPNSMLGVYYMARYYEEVGKPKRAMKTYEGAYQKEEVAFITVDMMIDKANKIKDDFGY